jgi:NTP pyrophosphatase (non-canonical NTP hydrolase)
MQAVAASVYDGWSQTGPWTLEELGELAQAIRRAESDPRILEELGQLFSWDLCLANITDVDLATAAGRSLRQEVRRQHSLQVPCARTSPPPRSGAHPDELAVPTGRLWDTGWPGLGRAPSVQACHQVIS